MKFDKSIAFFLAISAFICTGMCCYLQTDNRAVNTINTEITTQETTASAPETENYAVEITHAFIDSFGLPHIIIKNSGEQIYGYGLSIKYLDAAINLIEEKNVDIEAIVATGLTDGLDRFIPTVENAEYISAGITKLKYLEKEVEINNPLYTTDLLLMQEIKSTPANAECGFIGISEVSIIKQVNSNLSDLRFSVNNTGKRAIKNMEFLVAEYDNQGQPVSAKPNGYVKENIRKLYWENSELDANMTKPLASNMALSNDCTSVKIIVNYIEFQDRGVWRNPETFNWILSQGGN